MPTATNILKYGKPPLWGVIARAMWLVMFVSHAPAFLAACGELGQTFGFATLTRVALLSLSLALFALKAADVAWLRIPADRRVWLRLSIIVALLHANVLVRALEQADLRAVAPAALSTLWAVILPAAAYAGWRLFRLTRRLPVQADRICARAATARVRKLTFLPHALLREQLIPLTASPLRAPPARG